MGYGSKGKQDAKTGAKLAAEGQSKFKAAESPASVKKVLGAGVRVKYR